MKNKEHNQDISCRIPLTEEEGFKILDEMLSAEDIQSILSKSKGEFLTDEHFGLGLWIRNNWIYGDEDMKGIFAPKDGHLVILHPDYQSNEFLEKYYDHLKRVHRYK